MRRAAKKRAAAKTYAAPPMTGPMNIDPAATASQDPIKATATLPDCAR